MRLLGVGVAMVGHPRAVSGCVGLVSTVGDSDATIEIQSPRKTPMRTIPVQTLCFCGLAVAHSRLGVVEAGILCVARISFSASITIERSSTISVPTRETKQHQRSNVLALQRCNDAWTERLASVFYMTASRPL